MPIIFNMVTLLTLYCPEGFQLSVVDFQQCLEGCWDHRRLSEQSCLTLHQLELSQTWDKKRSLPSFPFPCFIPAPSRAKVEAHLPSLKIHAQQLFLFQLCGLLVHFQWPPGPVICGAQLIQLHADHKAHPSWWSSKFKFAYHKNERWALALKSKNFLFLQPLGEILEENSISAVERLQQWLQNCPTEPGLFSQQAGFPDSKGK